MKSPLATVKEKFGDKAKLVAALESFTKDEALWVSRTNESKGLAHVSNAKLIKLHATFTAVKTKFGTRAKLIDAIAELEKRKDSGFKTHLAAYPVPRLWDMFKASEKRNAPKKPATKVVKKAAPAPKKVEAKKAAPAAKVKAKAKKK